MVVRTAAVTYRLAGLSLRDRHVVPHSCFSTHAACISTDLIPCGSFVDDTPGPARAGVGTQREILAHARHAMLRRAVLLQMQILKGRKG